MISALATDCGADESPMSLPEMLSNLTLLLIAGHRDHRQPHHQRDAHPAAPPRHPQAARADPRHRRARWWKNCCGSNRRCRSCRERTTLDDIEIAGTTIPQGASLWLVPASGNRDPQRFPEPDRFLPDRPDNQHFGFGTGIHNCIGSPLARLEAQTALAELVRRLDNPRLVEDPPLPPPPSSEAPRHLPIACDGLSR
ncbi:Cytochrome P450 OS=Streptomyces antimycoticus OX=68175 GN=SSPO_046410 PE=3 SV=1 [Streptomyces antimycoticus]